MENSINAVIKAVQKNEIQHESILNNLANIDTIGFREQLIRFTNDIHIEKKNSGQTEFMNPYIEYSDNPGVITNTNRSLDVALLKNYWITVKKEGSKKVMYTRNGHIQLNSKNQLVIDGFLVLGEKGPITIPKHSNLNFLEDGTIISILKKKKLYLGKLKLASLKGKYLVKNEYAAFYNINKCFLHKKDKFYKSCLNHEKKLVLNSLEGSNVSMSAALVELMYCSRKFDFYTSIIGHNIENENNENKLLDDN